MTGGKIRLGTELEYRQQILKKYIEKIGFYESKGKEIERSA